MGPQQSRKQSQRPQQQSQPRRLATRKSQPRRRHPRRRRAAAAEQSLFRLLVVAEHIKRCDLFCPWPDLWPKDGILVNRGEECTQLFFTVHCNTSILSENLGPLSDVNIVLPSAVHS